MAKVGIWHDQVRLSKLCKYNQLQGWGAGSGAEANRVLMKMSKAL